MGYRTVFDLAAQPTGHAAWWAIGAVVVGVALAARWRARRRGRSAGATGFLVALGIAIALLGGALPMWDRARLLDALVDGRARVAEGFVTSHEVTEVAHRVAGKDTTRTQRLAWEAFFVGAEPFGYYRDATAVGFRNSGAARFALADGQRLRVHFVEDVEGDYSQRRILRIELSE